MAPCARIDYVPCCGGGLSCDFPLVHVEVEKVRRVGQTLRWIEFSGGGAFGFLGSVFRVDLVQHSSALKSVQLERDRACCTREEIGEG
jgi:hypothetical protein